MVPLAPAEREPSTTGGGRGYGASVLDAAPDGMLIVDVHGTIVLANRQAHVMFGYGASELVGQRVEMLMPEGLRAGHAAHRDAYVRAPRTRPMGSGLELLARRKTGEEFPVEISLSPMATPDGVVVIAAVRDITERKRIEADLRALNEDLARKHEEAERAALALAARRAEKLAALGTLAAGLAHELNNPIGIMSSRIQVMLMEGEGLPAHVREDLEVLHRQTQRVARITQGLLTFARSSAGERTPIDLNHIVRETLLLAENQIVKGGVKVTADLAPDLPAILGDADTLQQVMLNLVTNARDAVDTGGEIRIETRRRDSDRTIELVVADTGRGIAPEDLTRIFDPFFTTKPSGTGLGLSLTHGIVREHGGTIDVESAPGRGTRFILAFPALIPGIA
jgi:PAS domain S-box-containing protein